MGFSHFLITLPTIWRVASDYFMHDRAWPGKLVLDQVYLPIATLVDAASPTNHSPRWCTSRLSNMLILQASIRPSLG